MSIATTAQNLSFSMMLLAIFIACVAIEIARRHSPGRLFNACEMTLVVTNVRSHSTQSFTYGATSNSYGTRYAWISKFTKDSIANMQSLFPELDVHHLVVEVQTVRFHNSRGPAV